MQPSPKLHQSSSFDGGAAHGSVAGYYESTLKLEPSQKADDDPSCKLEWDLGSDDGIFLAPTIQFGGDASLVLESE